LHELWGRLVTRLVTRPWSFYIWHCCAHLGGACFSLPSERKLGYGGVGTPPLTGLRCRDSSRHSSNRASASAAFHLERTRATRTRAPYERSTTIGRPRQNPRPAPGRRGPSPRANAVPRIAVHDGRGPGLRTARVLAHAPPAQRHVPSHRLSRPPRCGPRHASADSRLPGPHHA